MNAVAKISPEIEVQNPLAKLREPFPDHQVSKLPKESKAQADARKANRSEGINCQICGGWHHRNAVHLDYVGHAALTDRLLEVDPLWSWEPVAFAQTGLPAFDNNGGLWIRLTVCGVTRLGYGNADGKSGGDAIKEIIGDALRNAAMRFGAALDLWHKGDLHLEDAEAEPSEPGWLTAAKNAVEGLYYKEDFDDWWPKNKASLEGKPRAEVDLLIDHIRARKAAARNRPPPRGAPRGNRRTEDDSDRFHQDRDDDMARDGGSVGHGLPADLTPFDDEIPF